MGLYAMQVRIGTITPILFRRREPFGWHIYHPPTLHVPLLPLAHDAFRVFDSSATSSSAYFSSRGTIHAFGSCFVLILYTIDHFLSADSTTDVG